MKFKFGDLVHYKPFYEPNCPCVLEIIDFDEKKQKYICMEVDIGFPGEDLIICLCSETDLEYLSAVADVNEYLYDGEPLITNPNLDLYYFDVFEFVGKEEIKIRSAVRRRPPTGIPIKKEIK